MGKASQVLIVVVSVVIGLILVANILPDVVKESTTESYSEPFSVSTGGGQTNTTETLSFANYYDDLTDLSASSDNEADTPVVLSYDPETYDTTVIGLAASDTRILTITYTREAHQEFIGFSTFVRLLPFLLIVGLGFAAIWGIVKH